MATGRRRLGERIRHPAIGALERPHLQAAAGPVQWAHPGACLDHAVGTGRAYDSHFVSVIRIKDRKVTHWRDYLDPVAVFNAVGWPAQHG